VRSAALARAPVAKVKPATASAMATQLMRDVLDAAVKFVNVVLSVKNVDPIVSRNPAELSQ
jgi:hypothetical protein